MTVAQAQGLRSRSAHLTWILGSDSSTEGTDPPKGQAMLERCMCVDGGGVPGVRPRSWSGPGDLSGGGSRGFGSDADLDPRIWSRSDDPIWIRGSAQSCTIFLEVLLVPFPLRNRWFWWWGGGGSWGLAQM